MTNFRVPGKMHKSGVVFEAQQLEVYHKAIIQKTYPYVFPESFHDIFELTLLERKEPKCPVAKLISFYLQVCKQFETLSLQ